MREEIEALDDSSVFFKLKLSHAMLNLQNLNGAMKKRTNKLEESFLDRKIVTGVGPWGKEIGADNGLYL